MDNAALLKRRRQSASLDNDEHFIGLASYNAKMSDPIQYASFESKHPYPKVIIFLHRVTESHPLPM
jgi:hypothetical protein